MRGVWTFLIWLAWFLSYIFSSGAVWGFFFFIGMVCASAYGGHVFAEWRRRQNTKEKT